MNDVCRVVVAVVDGLAGQDLAFLLIRLVAAEDFQEVVIVHLFQHTVGAHIEIVARLNVGDVDNVCLGRTLLIGHDDTRDDVLVLGGLHLVVGQLANLEEVVNQRVVARTVENLVGRGTQVVDAAVADVGSGASALVEAEERQGGSHLLLTCGVLSVDGSVSCVEGFLKQRVLKHAILWQVAEDVVAHGLTYGSAGDFARFVSAHSVAENKESVSACGVVKNGENRVFLILSAT